MKKLSVLVILAVAAFAAFMTSCDKEPVNTTAPSIHMITGDTSIASGAGITIKGNIEAPGNIGTITYYKDGVAYGTPITSGFDSDTATYFEVQFTNVTEAFTFKVEVEDLQKEPKSTMSDEITIGLGLPVDKKAGMKLFCALADQSGHEMFGSLTPEFETYDYSDAEANASNVDVMYYNGPYTKAGEHPRLVSPDAAPNEVNSNDIIAGAKSTTFKVLTGDELALFADWANIDTDTEISSITGITANNTLTLAVGSIVAFELADGKKGVIKINSWTAGWGINDYILFDVIVQQNAPVTK